MTEDLYRQIKTYRSHVESLKMMLKEQEALFKGVAGRCDHSYPDGGTALIERKDHAAPFCAICGAAWGDIRRKRENERGA